MQQSEMHYLPLSPGYFSLLVGAFEILLLLIQFGSLRYARQRGRSDRVIICRCPLLALSGHFFAARQCPLSGG
jgi:hypothetical protein